LIVIQAWTRQGEHFMCDGRCFNPRDKKAVVCRCLCQGLNHDAGWRNATSRTRANAARWIKEHDDTLPDDNKIVRWTVAAVVTVRLQPEFMWQDDRFFFSPARMAKYAKPKRI
jgi:hypothetical protein